MSWDARQTAMLAAMGLRVWPRAAAAEAPEWGSDEPEVQAAEPESTTLQPDAPPVAAPEAISAAAAASLLPPRAPAMSAPPAPAQRPTRPLGEREQALAGLDWLELRHEAAECQACRLCQGRRGHVFGAGEAAADWLIVADPSGEAEDPALPAGGDAAALLANMLRALKLDPAPALGRPAAEPVERARQAFITLPLKCRPGPGGAPGPAELQQCRPILARQVALVQPRVIVALGRASAQALLGSDEPLGRLRGRVHRHQGIPVLVSYGLDYLLRSPADKAGAWADLCLALESIKVGS